jgi:hypothetical protein
MESKRRITVALGQKGDSNSGVVHPTPRQRVRLERVPFFNSTMLDGPSVRIAGKPGSSTLTASIEGSINPPRKS